MGAKGPRVAVVGHVEWVEFVRVDHVPCAGEVVHAQSPFQEAAGGGAVAAVQLARLAGGADLYTALGRDDAGERSLLRLSELGLRVHASRRPEPTRRAMTMVDRDGERTITTLGARLAPGAADGGWDELQALDGVYFTAGDARALGAARSASQILVASPRAGEALAADVRLDALVLSASDPIELAAESELAPKADLVVWTEGSAGGRFRTRSGETGRFLAPAPPGPVVDSYGCGDAFAAGFTYGLAAALPVPDALELGARCGAAVLCGSGPYGAMLDASAVFGRGGPAT